MKRWPFCLVILLSACGQAPVGAGPSVHISATATLGGASPTASQSPVSKLGLLVVLEARGAGSTFGAGPGAYDAHDTVAIAGIDGIAKAKQTFKPRTLPFIGNAGAVLQPEARVAAGAVFYIDGAGSVRRLDVNGAVTRIASFPFGQQQEVSFAVSPDGKHLVASVLTLPARNPNAQTVGDPPYLAGSHAFLELFSADTGGAARSMGRTDLGTDINNSKMMRVVGWDAIGPVVTLQQNLGSQQGSLGNGFEGWQLAHLDSSGRAGSPITPADCYPWQELADMSVLCSSASYGDIKLIAANGTKVVSFPGASGPFLAVSPDGSRVAFLGGVQDRGGKRVTLPDTFFPEGWLDASTIVGYVDTKSRFGATVGNMALIRLSNPAQLDDLGFTGVLAGVL
jgi:hypothetical protein